MYAVLDIETTGGQFNEEGITEIAIYRFDGHEVVDQFISLVNPEIPIQPFVVKLTGINNAMLRSAPKFFEVAKRIIEITKDCVIVAHNASFDYRILRTEFKRLGYDFESQTLCTVELAQKLIPEQPSYSLGKLVRGLGIPIADRHRAGGDAMATLKLFKLLLDKDLGKEIVKSLIHTEVIKGLSPKLLDIVEHLPSRTGIYYIHNQDGRIIYIGKSRNIKKRVNQHFTGTTSKCKKIQLEVFAVTYEETGSELVALLKESEEIKVNKPVYNRAQKKTIFPWGLFAQTDANGYLRLTVERTDAERKTIATYSSLQEGKNALHRISNQYRMCHKLNGLQDVDGACFPYRLKQCDGACVGEELPETYNLRIQEFIDKLAFEHKNLVIIDRGRKIDERSAVVIEDGQYKGYAFFDLNYQVHNLQVLKNILVPMQHNRDTYKIIADHLAKNKATKVVSF
ncbi:exonuclease domain-containing protein [Flavobacterium caeni]|uniref:DNA polymerase-3 subunit epsilon n=1 Tax=Flavobacterium caeni TaxID=490189 RepID=A0A1G5BH56_9FLAO|nr:exonuclease domain-containing protein [Flavobacterium caeni]SCX89424.1 DNA polymerase-3 subunit epsilon [Flavobacterium caeni]